MLRKLVTVVCLVALVPGCAQARRAVTGDSSVSIDGIVVLVSTVDIPTGALLDPLIAQGKFQVIMVPTSAVVPGAVENIEQLLGMCADSRIYQNEQIPLARLSDACPERE